MRKTWLVTAKRPVAWAVKDTSAGAVRRDLEPDVIALYVDLCRFIGCLDHYDKLSLGKPNDLIPDSLAVLNSNLDPCLGVCRILCLLRGKSLTIQGSKIG